MSANTQDRELLEMAAKAAGIEVIYCPDKQAFEYVHPLRYDNRFWSPITDDAQALRLAKACNIVINFDEDFVEHWKTLRYCFGDNGKTVNDAVLACAAEIGRDK